MAPIHKKRISVGPQPVTSGFTPGFIPSDYSYLQRSHSLVTPTRRNIPRGLAPHSTLDRPTSNPQHTPSKDSNNFSLHPSDSLPSPRLARADMDLQTIEELVAQLPPNPKLWTPSQVALYLTHVLGLTPKPVVEDVTNYVRRSRMGGKVFMRLREKDLESEGLNLKWRKLMIEAVKKLRRDCLKGKLWGYEGGLSWPRQDDTEIPDDVAADEEVEVKHRLPITAMGTLKRLRDKKAIRGMIFNFENVRQESKEDEEGGFATFGGGKGLKKSNSSHSYSSSDEQSPRVQMAPIYGKGFVKSRAESFTSLNDLEHHSNRKEFTKEELEHWFGSLSDQEAEALANELQEDEELQHSDSEEDLSNLSSTSYSTHSSLSGESELCTPPPLAKATFALTPLKPEVVDAIVGDRFSSMDSSTSTCDDTRCVEPLHRDFLIDEEQDKSADQLQSLAQFRSGRANRYRGSTYEPEDIEALGLLVGDEEDNVKFETARKISGPPSYCEEEFEEESRPVKESRFAHDSIRVKRKDGGSTFVKDIFANVDAIELTKPISDHMRHMSAHEASGLSPYKAVGPSMSRKSSQRKHADGERSAMADLMEARVQEGRENNATFGRKGGAKNTQLTAMLKASGIYDGPNAATEALAEDGKKAEDESEWGITVSRKASRKGTLARNTAREKDGTASRMAELFTPAPPSCQLSEDNLKELEKTAVSSRDELLVPLTTFEPCDDGKGSIQKQSMVLVERKRFEALAKRMGVLESQLAQLEAASLPSLSELGSMSDRTGGKRSLDQVFAIPIAPMIETSQEEEEHIVTTSGDMTRTWSLPTLLGAIPSYGEYPWSFILPRSQTFSFTYPTLRLSSSDLALGLGAGIGFVILSEVMGRTRH